MALVVLMRSSVLLLLFLFAGAVDARASPASATISSISTNATGLSHFFYVDSCPQLETIVRAAVTDAVAKNVRLTAGLLRILFHDCFPNGCDASILLDGSDGRTSERDLVQNGGLQVPALQLIEDIRAKVHAACGATVSCADITVLATRDAVTVAGGPSFNVKLGRLDGLAPASSNDVGILPPPTADVDTLLDVFSRRGLSDPADLVALSGAHTVGKSRCSNFGAPQQPGQNDDMITSCVLGLCSGGDGNKLRDLDFLTPEVFDNFYFIDLVLKKRAGVMMPSDQGLATHPRTNWLVQGFADNHWWFFQQFATSMEKMSKLTGPQGNVGEVRRNCFKSNARSSGGLAASA